MGVSIDGLGYVKGRTVTPSRESLSVVGAFHQVHCLVRLSLSLSYNYTQLLVGTG